MPCVIAESLCCGTPVISTNVGGIAEILNDTNGILVDKGNQDQLMEAILKILRNEKLFNRKQIAEDAIQLFSEESIGNQLMEIYSKCL
jgi:glycosyltransferase involved in cell wall biosynthesis